MSNDNINHPSHYNELGVEVWEIVRKMNFAEGNVWKYMLRAPFKGHPSQDVKKALWYIESESYMPRASKVASATWKAIDTALVHLAHNASNHFTKSVYTAVVALLFDKKRDGETHDDMVRAIKTCIAELEAIEKRLAAKTVGTDSYRTEAEKLIHNYEEGGKLIDFENLKHQMIWGMAVWAQKEMNKEDLSESRRRELRQVRNQAFKVYKGQDADLCIGLADKPGALKSMSSICIDTGSIVRKNYEDAMLYKTAGDPHKKELAIIAKISDQCYDWMRKQANKCIMLMNANKGRV